MARIVYVLGAVLSVCVYTTHASVVRKRQAVRNGGGADDLEDRYGDFGFGEFNRRPVNGFGGVNRRPGRQDGSVGQNGQTGFGQNGQNGLGQADFNLEEVFGPPGQSQIGQNGIGQNGQTSFGQSAQNAQTGLGQNGQNVQTGFGQNGQTAFGQNGQTGLGQSGQQQNQSSEAAILACTRSCLATSEYNPVCGSDGRSHQNEGRFQCVNRCNGGTLTIVSIGQCPPATTRGPGTRR